MAKWLGVNSIGYLSPEGLVESTVKSNSSGSRNGYCRACFTGIYPVPVAQQAAEILMEEKSAPTENLFNKRWSKDANVGGWRDACMLMSPCKARIKLIRQRGEEWSPGVLAEIAKIDLVVFWGAFVFGLLHIRRFDRLLVSGKRSFPTRFPPSSWLLFWPLKPTESTFRFHFSDRSIQTENQRRAQKKSPKVIFNIQASIRNEAATPQTNKSVL